ncbi:helix-turn-helix domain-containing protein [Veronia nyctiphanis]|nr:helix-turn-helix domain-containing protein [Veronia nyctiphanis]
MSQRKQLVQTLKALLRQHGVTYRIVAQHLQISEASVKRLFSTCDFTIERIEKVCELVSIELSDLVMAMQEGLLSTSELSVESEKALVSDIPLLLTAHLLINKWTVNQILSNYDIDRLDMIQNLVELDRMRIIDYLPGEKVRLKLSRNFQWQENGPIQQFFNKHISSEFFKSTFDQPGELRLFASGMLSKTSNQAIQHRLTRLQAFFDELHRGDEVLEMEQRYGTSIVLAVRPWSLPMFEALRKPERQKTF